MTHKELNELLERYYIYTNATKREVITLARRSIALVRENAELRVELDQYRWRPIEEIHEDMGPCVMMRIDDPGYFVIGSNLDEDFNEPGFTHFTQVPKLTTSEAEALAAKPAPLVHAQRDHGREEKDGTMTNN